MSEEPFTSAMPDLQAFIKQLDMFNDEQNEAVRVAINKVGDNIVKAQKHRISGAKVGEKKLAAYISRSRVYTTKKGAVGVKAGYQEGAFKTDPEGFNPGVVGMTYEFGRPGKSPERSGTTMEQTRKRIPNKSAKRSKQQKAVPTRVTIEKGTIQPVPHIRAGFDATLEENIQTVVDAVNDVLNKLGGST